jgi:hypothetical protein
MRLPYSDDFGAALTYWGRDFRVSLCLKEVIYRARHSIHLQGKPEGTANVHFGTEEGAM